MSRKLRAPGGGTPRAAQNRNASAVDATPGSGSGQQEDRASAEKAAAVTRYLHDLASLAETQAAFSLNPAWVNA
jgi:hypothetical protein